MLGFLQLDKLLENEELCEYELSSLQLRKRSVDIKLRNHDIDLILEVPDYGVTSHSILTLRSSRVLRAHTAFKKRLEPGLAHDDKLYKRCAAEIILSLLGQRRNRTSKNTRIPHLTHTLYDHCTQWLPHSTAQSFFKAVCEVLKAQIDRLNFLQGHIPNNLATYMGIRVRTIALKPFFDVIKHELLSEDYRFNKIWDELQMNICRAVGLQNDLIGLERDMEDGEPLNAVTVLMTSHNDSLQTPGKEEHFARYIK
ncbi:hypothetical protein F4802DRAFT_613414 [Xylaria palmicola]|nr:hypothetical protein F4802DRAFT_613414 [Xylaria palmicola]